MKLHDSQPHTVHAHPESGKDDLTFVSDGFGFIRRAENHLQFLAAHKVQHQPDISRVHLRKGFVDKYQAGGIYPLIINQKQG